MEHGLSDNTGQPTLRSWSFLHLHIAFYHSLSGNTGQPTFFRRSLEMSDKDTLKHTTNFWHPHSLHK